MKIVDRYLNKFDKLTIAGIIPGDEAAKILLSEENFWKDFIEIKFNFVGSAWVLLKGKEKPE